MKKDTLVVVVVGMITGVGGYYAAYQQRTKQTTDESQDKTQAQNTKKSQPAAATAARPHPPLRTKLPRPRKTKEQIAALRKKWQNKTNEATHAKSSSKEAIDTGYLDTPEPVESYSSSSKEFRAAVDAGVREIIPEIRKCMQDWKAEIPAFNGRVSFHIEIGQQGLHTIEVDENDEIPLIIAGCMGNVMYTAQWPATTDGKTTVNYPFALSLE